MSSLKVYKLPPNQGDTPRTKQLEIEGMNQALEALKDAQKDHLSGNEIAKNAIRDLIDNRECEVTYLHKKDDGNFENDQVPIFFKNGKFRYVNKKGKEKTIKICGYKDKNKKNDRKVNIVIPSDKIKNDPNYLDGILGALKTLGNQTDGKKKQKKYLYGSLLMKKCR